MMKKKEKHPVSSPADIIGLAGMDYWLNNQKQAIIEVWSDVAETDELPVHYLFRDFYEMPDLEQKALMLCKGSVLDVGAGMGSHARYLQNKGMDIVALETSPLACEVMHLRGVKQVVNHDFFSWTPPRSFDTILMLMNGIGICGTVMRLKEFFQVAKTLLKPGGQIFLDSSDLRYLFLEDDGSMLINLNGKYYGEVIYKMSYQGNSGKRFPWLFIDDELLGFYARKNGFEFEKIAIGPHFDFLARLYVSV